MKEMVKMVNKQKDPEEKLYLICITDINDSDYTSWQMEIGRKNTRQFIIDNIDIINFDESFVLVEGCTLEQRKSIYAFLKHMEQFFQDDSFDIDEYLENINDNSYNNIDESLSINNDERLEISSIMNGNISFTDINNKKEE